MTEYDYSPEAHDRYVKKMRGIERWAGETNVSPLRNPFTPATPAMAPGEIPGLRAPKPRRGETTARVLPLKDSFVQPPIPRSRTAPPGGTHTFQYAPHLAAPQHYAPPQPRSPLDEYSSSRHDRERQSSRPTAYRDMSSMGETSPTYEKSSHSSGRKHRHKSKRSENIDSPLSSPAYDSDFGDRQKHKSSKSKNKHHRHRSESTPGARSTPALVPRPEGNRSHSLEECRPPLPQPTGYTPGNGYYATSPQQYYSPQPPQPQVFYGHGREASMPVIPPQTRDIHAGYMKYQLEEASRNAKQPSLLKRVFGGLVGSSGRRQ